MERIDKYELPIETENIPCVTNCWIYNRLIIIKPLSIIQIGLHLTITFFLS